MSPITDTRSPGGWLQLYGVKISKKLIIGTTSVLAAFVLYGSFQGRQAVHYAEVDLTDVSRSGALITSWAWPLSETGYIIADHDSYVYTETVPSPASKLKIGVGTSTATGTEVALISINTANTVYTLAGCGSTKLPGRVRVGPGQYVNFSWYNGSGQTVGGVTAGFARIKVEPCGTSTFDCD